MRFGHSKKSLHRSLLICVPAICMCTALLTGCAGSNGRFYVGNIAVSGQHDADNYHISLINRSSITVAVRYPRVTITGDIVQIEDRLPPGGILAIRTQKKNHYANIEIDFGAGFRHYSKQIGYLADKATWEIHDSDLIGFSPTRID